MYKIIIIVKESVHEFGPGGPHFHFFFFIHPENIFPRLKVYISSADMDGPHIKEISVGFWNVLPERDGSCLSYTVLYKIAKISRSSIINGAVFTPGQWPDNGRSTVKNYFSPPDAIVLEDGGLYAEIHDAAAIFNDAPGLWKSLECFRAVISNKGQPFFRVGLG